MLDEVVAARTVLSGVIADFAHGIELVETGKNEFFTFVQAALHLKFHGL